MVMEVEQCWRCGGGGSALVMKALVIVTAMMLVVQFLFAYTVLVTLSVDPMYISFTSVYAIKW